MPTLSEIKVLADQLQVALDAEQSQITELLAQKDAAIAALNTTIANLQALVTSGGTEAERQEILDGLNTIKTDLEATVAP